MYLSNWRIGPHSPIFRLLHRARTILYLQYWLGLVAVPVIVAQDSSNIANCTDSRYDWTFSSLGQSPCYVANVISEQCSGQMYGVPPTGPEHNYSPLPSYYADYTCFCNTVWYSLLSACALCQDGNWLTWPDYSLTCNKTYLMEYPDPIPSNTSIPTWAYLNVTVCMDDNFATSDELLRNEGNQRQF
ncbi:hypothetical protein F5887DRAFT_47204 [Amanita rubescens]|nr:hypothetical protein F5887DRAFT_47204 [Amanita rubescens]